MAAPPSARRVLATTPFRVVVVLHAALLCAQPVLIGQFLSGQFPRLDDHELIGSMVIVTCIVQFPTALLACLVGRWPAWPVAVTLAMFFGEGIQMGAGHERNLALHIPLGVALVAVGLFMAGWACLPRRAPVPAGS